MIIYGSKPTTVATEIFPGKCASCDTENSVQMSVLQNYAHVFWIPFFPIGKTAVSQCNHCKQVLKKDEFPAAYTDHYHVMKIGAKTPVWTFSGLILLTALIVWANISGNKKDERNAKWILAPVKGDVYEIKDGVGQYTLYKVTEVVADTVYVLFNQYETNKSSGINELKAKGDEAYLQIPMPMLKSQLKAKLDKGEILDIDRK